MSKLLYGKEIQVKVDPKLLDRQRRNQIVHCAYSKRAGLYSLLFSAISIMCGAILAAIATPVAGPLMALLTVGLMIYAVKGFQEYGYEKANVEDWESKMMVRMDG